MKIAIPKCRIRFHAGLATIVAGLSLFSSPAAIAATDTWTGSTGGNFNVAGNWLAGNVKVAAG